LSSCGKKSDQLAVFTTQNCDLLHKFSSNYEDYGHVVFVISPVTASNKRNARQRRLVGFSQGIIKRIQIDNLTVDDCYKVQLNPGEKLTCGYFSENNLNFLVGTNQGTLIIGSMTAVGKNRVDIKFCRLENIGNKNSIDGKNNFDDHIKS
jgi:hypothetical protein